MPSPCPPRVPSPRPAPVQVTPVVTLHSVTVSMARQGAHKGVPGTQGGVQGW